MTDKDLFVKFIENKSNFDKLPALNFSSGGSRESVFEALNEFNNFNTLIVPLRF